MWCEVCRYVADGAGRAAEEVKQREKARKHVNLEVKVPGIPAWGTLPDHKTGGLSTFFSTIVENFAGSPAATPQGGDFNTGVVSTAMRPPGAGERGEGAGNRGDSRAKSGLCEG